jgi:tRNA (cytidine/uridine-2'-O-)-methyltransferase
MFNVILYQPEIPPNTGNVIRLCANTGARLHLIRPLGFDLDDKQLRRAGLDYHEYATLQVHDSLAACLQSLPQARDARLPLPNPPPLAPLSNFPPQAGERASEKGNLESPGEGTNESLRELVVTRRLFAFTTKGSHPYHEVKYQAGDAFLFGPESRGLPADVLGSVAPERRLRLPMLPDNRSLNLSNTVAVAVFEAWRQLGFSGSV